MNAKNNNDKLLTHHLCVVFKRALETWKFYFLWSETIVVGFMSKDIYLNRTDSVTAHWFSVGYGLFLLSLLWLHLNMIFHLLSYHM